MANGPWACYRRGQGNRFATGLPAKALGGVTLVISPLTALMDEQASKLQELACRASVWHSGFGSQEQYNQLIALYRGTAPDFIFLSPERVATDGFLEFALKAHPRPHKAGRHRRSALHLPVGRRFSAVLPGDPSIS